jgi:hypothetical protein
VARGRHVLVFGPFAAGRQGGDFGGGGFFRHDLFVALDWSLVAVGSLYKVLKHSRRCCLDNGISTLFRLEVLLPLWNSSPQAAMVVLQWRQGDGHVMCAPVNCFQRL